MTRGDLILTPKLRSSAPAKPAPGRRLFTDNQLRRESIDTLKRYLRYKLDDYKVAIGSLTLNNQFYRGVKHREVPNLVAHLSYPPAAVAKDGRANRAGVAMFYCSGAAPAVPFELRAKPGDLIALSAWRLKQQLWVHNLGYHADALRRMGAPSAAVRPSAITDPIPNESRANARLRRLLSLAFTEDVRDGEEFRYKQTIAINELLFDKAAPLHRYADGPQFDEAAGTAYPAMQMMGAADNLALLPKFVDSSLAISMVLCLRVETVDERAHSYTTLTVAHADTFHDGVIHWRTDEPPAERDRRSHISFEDGQWVLRNDRGQIYHVR